MKRSIIAAVVFVAFTASMNLVFEIILDVSLLDEAQSLVKEGGLPAAMVVLLLLGFDVVLPVPSSVVMVISGALFGTLAGGTISLAGSLLGNLFGFELMRRYGPTVFRGLVKEDHIRSMQPLVEDFGAVAIAVSRPIPIMMESMTLVAGLLRMKRARFLAASLLGTVPITYLYSYAGSSSVEVRSVVPAIFILVCLPAVVWGLTHRWILRARRVLPAVVLALIAGNSSNAAGQSADIVVGRLVGSMSVKQAQSFIEQDHQRILADTVALERDGGAKAFADLLKAGNASNVEIDSAGNVVGTVGHASDRPVVAVAAHLQDSRALAALLAAVRALRSEDFRTPNGILVIGFPDRHDAVQTPALDHIFAASPYKDRIRSFLVVETREADRVSAAPKTIGSTTVQLALEVISSFGVKPHYQEDTADRDTPLSMRIPSIAIGCGYSTPKGIQVAMTIILAMAGN